MNFPNKPLYLILMIVLLLSIVACKQSPSEMTKVPKETKSDLSPEERYGALFTAIQLGGVFPDSKTFVDCTPKFTTDEILQKYNTAKGATDFDLKAFVLNHFDTPKKYASGFKSDTSRTAAEHINVLWEVLKRKADQKDNGSLLSLPKSYIVPGGRFGEIYYWDSYFTILGLQVAGKTELIENMADNFSFLIDKYGFIPNGNRQYYLGRSQPPFYALIVRVLEEEKGEGVLKKYLPYLEKEYQFWMDGTNQLDAASPAHRRVVRLADGSILNRYWDDRPTPRPESFKEDYELAQSLDRPKEELYRHIRAACESGWDFSSRWFKDEQYRASIHTTDIIPVDLNCLLYHLEETIASAYETSGNETEAKAYKEKAAKRKANILKYCWNKERQFFEDYDFISRKMTGIHSLAAMYPLYFNIADEMQAGKVASHIEKRFLKSGGVLTTLNSTEQQWDAPNGWAPLQWITIKGLRNYKHQTLANTIKERWVNLNVKVYQNTGKMVEKYNVVDISLEAGGGEYPVQDGFGWTNGVLLKLLQEDLAMEK